MSLEHDNHLIYLCSPITTSAESQVRDGAYWGAMFRAPNRLTRKTFRKLPSWHVLSATVASEHIRLLYVTNVVTKVRYLSCKLKRSTARTSLKLTGGKLKTYRHIWYVVNLS